MLLTAFRQQERTRPNTRRSRISSGGKSTPTWAGAATLPNSLFLPEGGPLVLGRWLLPLEDKWYVLEVTKNGLKDWLKSRTVGVC